MKITVSVTFKGGKGHCYLTIVPSDYDIIKIIESEAYDYDDMPDKKYDIIVDGVSPAGGTTIVVYIDDEEYDTLEIEGQGYFSDVLKIAKKK